MYCFPINAITFRDLLYRAILFHILVLIKYIFFLIKHITLLLKSGAYFSNMSTICVQCLQITLKFGEIGKKLY